ncbi:MAG: hypothetical protein WBV23_11815 [Desulfobaccales bacterium]
MTDAKIVFKVGTIEFTGEGEQEWLSQQLDKILEKAADLSAIVPQSIAPQGTESQPESHAPMGPDANIAQQTLAAFLREKNATAQQTKKFLATAVWLEAKGKNRLTTGDVIKALKDSNQTKLSNPSRSLTANVSAGFCERDGKEFFVTEDGKTSL